MLRLLEAALQVSEYTDKVDIISFKGKVLYPPDKRRIPVRRALIYSFTIRPNVFMNSCRISVPSCAAL